MDQPQTSAPPLDAQTIALLGTSYVRMLLQRDGVEVAEPARDRGIDLIAYLDQGETRFYARPIQVKSSLKFRWTHHIKYKAFRGLLLVHVMHLENQSKTQVYVTDYSENHAIAKKLKYLKRPLWADSTDAQRRVWIQADDAPTELGEALKKFLAHDGTWKQRTELDPVSRTHT